MIHLGNDITKECYQKAHARSQQTLVENLIDNVWNPCREERLYKVPHFLKAALRVAIGRSRESEKKHASVARPM
jgi:hypothetical protein